MTNTNITHIFKNISNNLDSCNNKIETSMNAMLKGGNSDMKSYKTMKKYKQFVDNAQRSVLYFRSLAEYYYRINLLTTAYYQGVAQKLNEMKQKMIGMDSKVQNIASQYQHNSEKIQMLEYFVDMIEKMAKNPTEIDLNIKSQLNDKMLQYQTNTKMSLGDAVSTLKQFDLKQTQEQIGGGEKSFEELEQIIVQNEQSILNSFANIDFLNKKMTSLNERMKQVVESNDSLFKLRTEVEWVINTLENCADGTCDKKAVSHNFDKLWKIVNGIQDKIKAGEKYDTEVLKYINGLEKYIGVLETQLNSADRTVRALDIKNDEKVKTHTEDLKTELNKKQSGGLLMEEEYEKENANKKNITEHNALNYIECEIKLENLENKEYAKYVMLKTVIKTLNDVMEQFFEICNKDKNFYDENQEFNFLKLWKETFKSKKTSYYNDLLEKRIKHKNEEIIAKKFNVELDNKITLNVEKKYEEKKTDESEKYLSNIISLLEDTKSFYICANYVTAKYIVAQMIINQDELSNINKIDELNVILKEYGNNLHKATHLTFKNFSETYDEKQEITTQVAGGLPHMHILPPDVLVELTENKNKLEIYSILSYYMYLEYATVIKENPELKPIDVMTEINKSIIAKIKILDDSVGDLYEMVTQKIGDYKSYHDLTRSINASDADLVTIAEKLEIFKQKQNGGKSLLGGGETKPRLDPFKIQLYTCKTQIEGFAGSLITLKEWMKKNASGKLTKGNFLEGKYNPPLEQSKLLLQMQKHIDHIVVSGRNSYIKVIPMVFFIIEFPPHIYLDDKPNDYYKFTYGDQKIKYTHYMDNVDPETKEYNGAHAAFFASNNKNGTSYLLKDPLIGLDKIIAVSEDKSKPENKVINMMFALGASGTGKTTRYFGKSDSPDTNDKQGVVSFVIENAKNAGALEINLAYFVCYGQYDKQSSTQLNELIIFLNNDKTGDDKYMPYSMNVSNTTCNGYTDFYVKLMQKKLNKLNYSDIKNLLQGQENNISNMGSEFGSFRHIIENENSIWMTPNLTSQAITELFEKLIWEQKQIFTVMPTKNNIESSRGHTCVLLRFKYDDGSYKYFPLFDMAGTEDPKTVADFFTKFEYEDKGKKYVFDINKTKMTKLIKQINRAGGTIVDDIPTEGQNKTKEITMRSLTDLLTKSKIAREYVRGTNNILMVQQGGATKVKDLEDLANNDTTTTENNAEKFLAKLGKEGYYINHTIAMLIFATLCVGTSLNTTMDENGTDNFDGFENALNTELDKKYICLLDKQATECTNTRFILSKYGFSEILSKSCIWTQVLFSFLYWNNDTQQSYDNLCYQILHYKQHKPRLDNKMSYYVGRSNLIIDKYNLKKYIQDDVVYEGAVKLCEVLANTNIKDISVTNDGVNDGVKFKNDKNKNYVLQKSNGKIIAEKESESTISTVYVGARKSGDIFKKSTKPIKDETMITLENVTNISSEENPKKINILTFYVYMLEKQLKNIINSDNASVTKINSDSIILEYVNKIFVISEKYIDDMHSLVVGGPTGYKKENETYSAIQKMSLLKKITSTESFSTKSITIEKEHVAYLNKLIISILKFVDSNETQATEKIQKYKDSQVDPIITEINSKNISENSHDLFLLSYKESLAKTKENLSNSLGFSRQLKQLIEYGEKESGQYKTSIQEYNQMKRIKDGSLSATKMTMMHLVTGQTYKAPMVKNTLELCQVLYDSTDLKL